MSDTNISNAERGLQHSVESIAPKGATSLAKRKSSAAREEGRSLFPVSRVQKILKADKELPIVVKEAVFAISIATEKFIERITAASQKQAEREKRTTVQKKDVAVVVKRADEFFFLEEVILWEQEEPVSRSRRITTASEPNGGGVLGSLIDFIQVMPRGDEQQ